MKTREYKFHTILALCIALSPLSAHVVLDYPLGGETFFVGDTVTIQWHVQINHDQENWDLFFSSDAGANWVPLESDLPNSQLSYDWIITQDVTDEGRVNIYQDNVGNDYADWCENFTILAQPVGVEDNSQQVISFSLMNNYPNPFNPSTIIPYTLPSVADMELVIYDLSGRSIWSVSNSQQTAGYHEIQWQGTDSVGNPVNAGIYLCRLRVGNVSQTIKMIFLK